jgi:hypothetical protein
MFKRRAKAALLILLPTVCLPGEIGSYEMTQLATGPGGGRSAATRWFITPDKSRTEMSPDAANPAGSLVVITRRDRGVAWTLFPSRKAFMERPLDEGETKALGERFRSNLKVEDLGREMIMGHACHKQRVRGEVPIGSRKVRSVQTVWQCDGFDIPLRIEGEDGSRVRTTELNVGPQPDGLFEVPRGYRKVDSLMEALGSGGTR